MKAEIVAIGSELTSGAKLDTNSQWLSLQLAELGIVVAYHTTMSDSIEAMTEVFEIASGRCDLVLITGGLGPTLDDITRDALAALAGVELAGILLLGGLVAAYHIGRRERVVEETPT